MRPRRARLGCEAEIAEVYGLTLASMRPRRARLGCLRIQVKTATYDRSFNEAEARAPRMLALGDAEAPGIPASMRPRRARLGCDLERRIVGDPVLPLASMRPRRARLGCLGN